MTPVSVAMATYQGAPYVTEQVRSIIDQTVPVDELLVADDASRDGTVDVIRRVVADAGERAPELRVVAETRAGGVVPNLTRALQAARFPVILLSDQDDEWMPDRVETTLTAFGGSVAPLLVSGDALLIDADGQELGTLYDALGIGAGLLASVRGGRGFEALLRRNLATGATAAVHVDLLSSALPVPDGWLHDEWFAIVAAATDRWLPLDARLIRYRQHGQNEVGASRPGVAELLGRLTVGRDARNARLLTRAASLEERAHTLGLSPERRQAVTAKLEHERRRSALPRSRPMRLPGVLRAWSGGGYRGFGGGARDALRDLVQPPGASGGPDKMPDVQKPDSVR